MDGADGYRTTAMMAGLDHRQRQALTSVKATAKWRGETRDRRRRAAANGPTRRAIFAKETVEGRGAGRVPGEQDLAAQREIERAVQAAIAERGI